jgi:hypothetical protein
VNRAVGRPLARRHEIDMPTLQIVMARSRRAGKLSHEMSSANNPTHRRARVPLFGSLVVRLPRVSRADAGDKAAARSDRRVRRAQRRRLVLAASIRKIVRSADAGPRQRNSTPPLATRHIRRSAMELLALAGELESDESLNPRGIELTHRLITDGTGPLYAPTGFSDLELAVHQTRAALRATPAVARDEMA